MSVQVAPPHPPLKAIAGPSQAQVRPAQEALRHHQHVKACCVLGTPIGTSELREAEVIAAYTGQSSVEGGCRVLQDPLLLVSSWLGTKPRRIEGLVRVMPLALVVSSVAQRRLRQP
jgi:transposase